MQSQISFSTGIGLTIFMTILLGSGAVLNIILGVKSIIKPSSAILTGVLVTVVLFAIYYFLLFWTIIKVPNQQTLEVTTKTVFGSKTIRYENITKVRLYKQPRGGYALHIHQTGVDKPAFKGGLSYKNAKKLVPFFQGTGLPFETKLFQRK